MGKALYRKYRPISLETVVGQDSVTKPLKEAISSGNFSHAYIFTGPRGCGKTSVARIFAHEINGFKYELEDSYVDIIEIDGASNTGVDNIRDLREKAMIAPSEGKYKIYIIDEFHMLSKSAFNALLKILEEPPEHVIFLLATTNLEKVPITITSRAQIFNFKLADGDTMFKHLKTVAEKEGIKIKKEALDIIVSRGGGSFRDSISLLDQISNLKSKGEEITEKDIEEALGLPNELKIRQILDNFERGISVADALKDLLNSGTSAETLSSEIIEKIVERPTEKTLNLVSKLFNVQYPFAEAKLLVAFLESEKVPTAQVAASPTPNPSTPKPAVYPRRVLSDEETSSKKAALLARIEKSKKAEKERLEAAPVEKEPEVAALTDSVIQAGKIDLKAYVNEIKDINGMLGATVEESRFKIDGNNISIYPKSKTYVNILKSRGNLSVLRETAPGYQVMVIDVSEEKVPDDAVFPTKETKTLSQKEQKQIDKLSDIMGGEVKEASGQEVF
ncbi:MAG: DNA polymerase III subunit gamma/tau [Candidatus Saccharibacteria bacterium]|nr:DNA polymerase III subunit gamma/tau [Candidatus Saccharibacteria bacterium]